ncbi:MAG: DUF2723 domain-containing protein [Gemmatimonadetes bacterium]|nr:DUF2723 domain-containing protein [Gemmatimonadota bacterium]
MTASSPSSERPPYGVAAAVAAAVLGLYVLTIAPTAQFWDTSEYMSAAKVLGIPHPPGNPLFVLVAHVWGQLPLVAAYGLRINLFAAFTSAASSGLMFLVAERFLRDSAPKAPRFARFAAAAAGIVVGATSFTVWNQSTVNEKVYTLSLFSIALVLWLAVHWGDDKPGDRRDRWLILIGYIVALSSTNHMMGVLSVPAVVAYVLWTDWRVAVKPWALLLGYGLAVGVFGTWAAVIDGPPVMRVAVLLGFGTVILYAILRDPEEFRRPWIYLAIASVVVGVSLNYLFLRIRAGQFPPINEGEPTTWTALQAVLNREQYSKPPLSQRMADPVAQFANYWQYVTWQYGRDWGDWVFRISDALTLSVRQLLAVGFSALGLLGGWRQWRTDRRGAVAMTALIGTVTIVLIYYLNFRYGFSIYPDRELDREVRERDYFFVASFMLWGIWVALGLATLLEMGADFFKQRLSERDRWLAALPVLSIALIPLAGNRLTASRAGETTPRDFAVDLLESVEPYSILITAGDNDTFPLWYAQEVEGVRKDVLIANQSLMNTDWHLRQLKRRPIYEFDTTTAIPLYRGKAWPRPTTEPFTLTYDQLDGLPPGYQVPSTSIVEFGKVTAIIPKGIIERTDIAALQLIKDNLGKRPIYLSRTTGNWGDRLGLAPFLVGQGLARRLMSDSVRTGPSIASVQGLGFIDIPRSRALLFDVYHAEGVGRDRPRGWIDVPSEGILSLYWVVYIAWNEVVKQRAGDKDPKLRPDSAMVESGKQAEVIAGRVLKNTSFGRQRGGAGFE